MKKTGRKKEYDANKKECEDRNNSRNRDAFTITKSNGYLRDEQTALKTIEMNRSTNYNDVEDAIIALLDSVNEPKTPKS